MLSKWRLSQPEVGEWTLSWRRFFSRVFVDSGTLWREKKSILFHKRQGGVQARREIECFIADSVK
uniref:Uncharacterized protein n=1 Tax=Anguilla anguilla TaxID=7936 RepID=A0A0E9SI44_ANGAN